MDGEITPPAVVDLLDSAADVRVVDVRDPVSFRRGHVPGSVNVPFPELPRRVDELEGVERVVTVCPHGKASVQAARLIATYEGTADARVESMVGGLESWADEYGFELVGRDGSTTDADADDGR